MLELNFTPFPTLSSHRLLLREIVEEDAAEIFFLRSDRQVLEFLDRDPAQSINEAVQWIQTIRLGINNNEYIAWGISLKGDKTLIGTVNTASRKLLERNNFVREAYHKENYYYNGKFLDSAIYSLINPV